MPNYSDLIVEESYDLLDLAYACEEYGYPNDTSDMISEIATEAVGDDEWILKIAKKVSSADSANQQRTTLRAAYKLLNPDKKDATPTEQVVEMKNILKSRLHGIEHDARLQGYYKDTKHYALQDLEIADKRLAEKAQKDRDDTIAAMKHSMDKRSRKEFENADRELTKTLNRVKVGVEQDKARQRREFKKMMAGTTHRSNDDRNDSSSSETPQDRKSPTLTINGRNPNETQIENGSKHKPNIGVIALALAAAAVGGAILLKKHKAKAAARKAELSRTKYFEEHNVSEDKKDSYLYNLRKTIISDASKIINKLKSDKNIKTSGVNIVGRSSGIENGSMIQVIEKGSNIETVQSVMKALKDKYIDECQAGILSISYTEDKTGIKIIVK